MRTFGLILLAFVTGVGLMVAALSWQGRAAREYGRDAVQAAVRTGVTAETSCANLLNREPPATVQRCVVNVQDGQLAATVTLEGGRESVVRP